MEEPIPPIPVTSSASAVILSAKVSASAPSIFSSLESCGF
jgi:hypothetical protein